MQEKTKPIPIILDTDTYNEIDDQFALVYALSATDSIKLCGVTAAPFLNARSASAEDGMLKSYDEIQFILNLMNRKEIPVKHGSREFLKSKDTPITSEAADFIIEESLRIAATGDKLNIVAIGAITNVASAIIKDPTIVDRVKIIWLGSNNFECAYPHEFNLMQDVMSAQVVLDSKVDFVLIPCQGVASDLNLTSKELAHYLEGFGKAGEYLQNIFDNYMAEHKLEDKVIWDVAAVSYLTIPEATIWEKIKAPHIADDMQWIHGDSEHYITIAKKMDKNIIFANFSKKIKQVKYK